MDRYVDISFDCMPLRSVTRFDTPVDAAPEYRAWCERVKRAASKHGLHNTYYLYQAKCVFQLTNDPKVGMIEFSFEGTVLTDPNDQRTLACDLAVELCRETCDWLTEPIVAWLADTVRQAVRVEFDRYINAGDLAKAIERMERFQAESEQRGGYMGMGL